MNALAARHGDRIVLLLGLALVAAAWAATPWLLNIDEAIYYASARALAETGTLAVENGTENFGSEDLRLWFMVDGPNGLVAQYPAGSTLLGAPLWGAFGIRGLILLNALAAAGTLAVTRALARRLFADDGVALAAVLILAVATFWSEYAFGVWPHALGVLLAALGLYFAVVSIFAPDRAVTAGALSGLAVGAGMLVRLDTILLLPAIGAAAILLAPHPVRSIAGGALGLGPPLLLMAALNLWKFGVPNPVSYGPGRGGGVDLATYAGPLGLMLVTTLALVAFRSGRPHRPARFAVALGALALGLAIAVPVLREMVLAYLRGGWALAVDSRAIVDPRAGVVATGQGTLLFWGIAKKALGQSLPWLGLLALSPLLLRDRDDRPRALFLLIVVAVWTLPFFLRAWHGGLGGNMRYFLPLLPILCIVAARLVSDTARHVDDAPRMLGLGAASGAALVAIWVLSRPSGLAGAQQILALWLFLAVASVCALALLLGPARPVFARAVLGAAGAAMTVSFVFGVNDVAVDQQLRRINLAQARRLEALPDGSLVYGLPRHLADRLGDPDDLVAGVDSLVGQLDPALIRESLRAGRRVFVPKGLAPGLPGTLAVLPETGVDGYVEIGPGERLAFQPSD